MGTSLSLLRLINEQTKITMKTLFTLLVAIIASLPGFSQSPKQNIEGKIGDAEIKIVYHAPSVRGRTIMGELVPYNAVWRTGANDATTFEVSKDVEIEGKTLKAGKYSLFTIPGEKEWTIIFNKEPMQWGAFKYNQKKDALRVKVKSMKSKEMIEMFKISVEKNGVNMGWENTEVMFKVS